MITAAYTQVYSLDMLRDEARELIRQRRVDLQQPIYTLCRYLPEREWECIEVNLEDGEFLPRDRIIDLFTHERWEDD